MNNHQMLIEQVRRKTATKTNYAVAKALEIDQSQFIKVMAGKSTFGPKPVIRLAELLQRDVRDILVLIEEDKAKTPKDKEFWGRRSPRITASSVIAIVALLAAGIKTGNVQAEGMYKTPVLTSPVYTLCEVALWSHLETSRSG